MSRFFTFIAILFSLNFFSVSSAYADDVCGDGLTGATEQCDDGNTNNADGCSDVCVVESSWNCVGSPSVCTNDCTAGNYWNGATCAPATAGHFVPSAGATSQNACATGSYQPGTQSTSCIPATAGNYVDAPAATSQTPCAAGTTSGAAASFCTSIPTVMPNAFSPGVPAVASQVNDNFTTLVNKVNQLQAQLDALQAYAGPPTTATLTGVYDIFQISTDVDQDCPQCYSVAGSSSFGTVTFNSDGTGVIHNLSQYRQLTFGVIPTTVGNVGNSGGVSINSTSIQLNDTPSVDDATMTWTLVGGVVTVSIQGEHVTPLVVAGRMLVSGESSADGEGHNGMSILVRR